MIERSHEERLVLVEQAVLQTKEVQVELKMLWKELLHEVQQMRSDFERLLGKLEGAHRTILLLIALAAASAGAIGFFVRGAIGGH